MDTNFKLLRISNNLSTNQVAKNIGVSLRTYQNYENGSTEMTYETLSKTADFFGCSVDYLLGHQTKNIVYLDSLTENQKEAISLIKTLSERETAKVIGYIERIKETPLEDIILKHLESEE